MLKADTGAFHVALGVNTLLNNTTGASNLALGVNARDKPDERIERHRDREQGCRLGLPCEEGRGSFEQIALLLQTLDLAPQIPELIALSQREPIITFATLELISLTQLRSDCSVTPSATATSVIVRPPRTICDRLAAELLGYGGRDFGILDILSRLANASARVSGKSGEFQ